MKLRGQDLFLTAGGNAASGGMNAQCFCHFAPSAIHCVRTLICCGFSACPLEGGGIRLSGSGDVTRRISSLSSGLPATITDFAPSSVSKCSFALRLALSGPWQLKQRSERIGRTSRLNSTAAAWGLAAASSAQIARTVDEDFINDIVALSLRERNAAAQRMTAHSDRKSTRLNS